MLDQLEAQAPDALLALIKMYAQDPRDDKIDLGVGVYRTSDGATPVFRAIKAAEQRLVDTQDSKSYLGPEGDLGFVDALKPYVFGADPTMGGRVEGMQTPGGTGRGAAGGGTRKSSRCRHACISVCRAGPTMRKSCRMSVWKLSPFDHANADGAADIDALLQINCRCVAIRMRFCCMDVATTPAVSIIPRHSGLGLQMHLPARASCRSSMWPIRVWGRAWKKTLAACTQGAGARSQKRFVAYSCDKNFGLYRDRVGAFYMIAKQAAELDPQLFPTPMRWRGPAGRCRRITAVLRCARF